MIPSGKLTSDGIFPCLIGNTSSKGPFSVAMLDYRSVTVDGFGNMVKSHQSAWTISQWKSQQNPTLSQVKKLIRRYGIASLTVSSPLLPFSDSPSEKSFIFLPSYKDIVYQSNRVVEICQHHSRQVLEPFCSMIHEVTGSVLLCFYHETVPKIWSPDERTTFFINDNSLFAFLLLLRKIKVG